MEASTQSRAAEFVDHFAEGWAIGGRDPDWFAEHFASRILPDTRFIQPLAPTARGPEGMRKIFSEIFAVLPDLRAEVIRWGETERGVIIEFRMISSLVSWSAVDSFDLDENGMMRERVAYFDPLPVAAKILTRPRLALKMLPTLLNRKERK